MTDTLTKEGVLPATVQPNAKTSNFDWRKHITVHPAADLFPLLPPEELGDLAKDIEATGPRTNIVMWSLATAEGKSEQLLDGRNRLDALALLGLLCVDNDGRLATSKRWNEAKKEWVDDEGSHRPLLRQSIKGGDPYALVLSFNIHRRHLSAEDKRDLIAKVVKANPEQSNNSIAKQVKVDDKTVAKVRTDLEARSEIPNVSTRTDSKGRKQPAKKAKATSTKAVLKAVKGKAKAPKSGKPVAPEDTALTYFTAQVCTLLQRISNHEPKRFTETAVKVKDLTKLGVFFTDLANLKKGGGHEHVARPENRTSDHRR
jgi:hypothetical protein